MSLLLEALKKAEAAKRREEDPAAASETTPAEALPPARITPAHELELIDDEFAQAARFAGLDVPEPRPAAPPPPAPGAEAARVLFDAKRPAPRGKSPLTWLLAVAGLLLLGIVGWVMWQIGLLDSGRAVAPAASLSPPAARIATPAPAPMPSPAQSTASVAAVAPSSLVAGAPVTAPAALPDDALAAAPSSRFLSGQLAADAPAPTPPPAAAPAAPPIRITRNAPVIPQDINEGYAAFNAGEYDRARVAYERALRADPRNPDALHGLMALADVRGDAQQARMLLRRIAEIDPADPSVQVALSENVDPVAQEARLLNIAAAQPQSAPAAFALGNLYAGQARWREAQQAYFNAWTLAPDQPDHAYNLAVSLDQLRQSKLALQYYREAMTLRSQRSAAFDADAVAARIAALQAAPDGP
ncbi:MAG: tetratricopeptide repeat protein [Methyloversatilis sp.]|uniref:tetratricopeptide repeat protein n=1 Tax=Methyloversatilis sp. TaxID=2569862 RepID=UPI0027372C0B|nr:tetratricopeptide repeat protein [Methyloversatilis sp.]MDP2869966.1 tetratricopeptide repeat protein [Methyloversatilis sp.]